MDEGKGRTKPPQNTAPIRKYFVPVTYRIRFPEKKTPLELLLFEAGLAFTQEDFDNRDEGDPQKLIKDFDKVGIVGVDRTMVVVFCDLKGSTEALHELGGAEFQRVQNKFFCICGKAVGDEKQEGGDRYPRAVVDKYIGDCAMFYVDAGPTPRCLNEHAFKDRKANAASKCMKIIRSIVSLVDRLNAGEDLNTKVEVCKTGQIDPFSLPSTVRLGTRFGVALGSKVILSVLGFNPDSNEFQSGIVSDFTVTGPTVNLASRLEHASAADFLDALEQKRKHLDTYVKHVGKDGLRSSALEDEILALERKVVDLHSVVEENYQIRANLDFVKELAIGKNEEVYPWKSVPFRPKGFHGLQEAFLLGGDSYEGLFRRI